MDRILIRGGAPLAGTIPIGGAKNAALPLMAASLLLAPMKIRAQGAGEALVAFGMFVALGAGQSQRIGHRRDGRGAPRRCQSLLDAQADLDGEDDRDRLFRGIFRRLVGMGTAPCIDSRAIAIDGLQSRLSCLLESLEDGRCGGIRHRINCRTAPHHYSFRCSKSTTAIVINCLLSFDEGRCR